LNTQPTSKVSFKRTSKYFLKLKASYVANKTRYSSQGELQIHNYWYSCFQSQSWLFTDTGIDHLHHCATNDRDSSVFYRLFLRHVTLHSRLEGLCNTLSHYKSLHRRRINTRPAREQHLQSNFSYYTQPK
jgi:hypothetical protein